MRKALLSLALALCVGACAYGLTAAYMTGGGDTVYCQPTHEDVQYCRDDYSNLWRCEIMAGAWHCTYLGRAYP